MARGSRKPKTGTSMGWTSESPARKKRRGEGAQGPEKRWAAKAGPLKVYYRAPVTGKQRAEKPSE